MLLEKESCVSFRVKKSLIKFLVSGNHLDHDSNGPPPRRFGISGLKVLGSERRIGGFMRWARFVLFVSLFVVPLIYSWTRIECVRSQYQSAVESSTQGAVPPPSLKAGLEQMGPQNKQLIDWGGLLLAGVIALVITTKVHAIE